MIKPNGFHTGRTEALYVSNEYNLFVLTGQPSALGTPFNENNQVAVMPFNKIADPSIKEAFLKKSQPIEKAHKLSISFSAAKGSLTVYDSFVGYTLHVPLSALDTEVQEKLSPGDWLSNGDSASGAAFLRFTKKTMEPT